MQLRDLYGRKAEGAVHVLDVARKREKISLLPHYRRKISYPQNFNFVSFSTCVGSIQE